MSPLEAIALAACVFWLLLRVDRSRGWPSELLLPAPDEEATSSAGAVVAIVPARNESEVLPSTLEALLTQTGELVQVILVDDGSEDDTEQAARNIAAAVDTSQRLLILRSDVHPGGWSGKVHGQHQAWLHLEARNRDGSQPAPKWLLLIDADIRLRPGSLVSLLTRAQVGGEDGTSLDMVSIMARLRAERFWERLLIPAFVFFFQLLFPFRHVQRAGISTAAAAGGCVLIRRRALQEIGGFAAIRNEIIDDVALAKAVKGRGGRIWLGLDEGIESVRPYRRLRDLWQMVARTAFTQLHHSWILVALTVVALAILIVSPPVVLGWIGAKSLFFDTPPAAAELRAAVWALLAWILMSLALLPAVRHHRVPNGYATLLPVAGALYGLMTVSSAWNDLRGRGALWRGRRYR